MMHHSRNTAQKQWAETKVLTISGVVRVFNTKKRILQSMDDYSKGWLLLLEYVEKMALSDTMEVSLAALKAMQEMIVASGSDDPASPSKNSKLMETNWFICWKAWLNIGPQKTKFFAHSSDNLYQPQGQVLLTGFIHIFKSLFPFIENAFSAADVESLGSVLLACLQVPIDNEMENADSLTPIHAALMEAEAAVEAVALAKSHAIVAEIFEVLFKFVSTAFNSPKESRFAGRMVVLGEVAMERIGDFFLSSCSLEHVDLERIIYRIVLTLKLPLRQKYRCRRQSSWQTAINVLIRVLKEGIPLARKRPDKYAMFWSELSQVLECFLFPDSIQEQRQEDKMSDEALDCTIVDLLRDEVLPHPTVVPADFIRKIVILLNKGSIHSSIQLNEDCSGSVGLREDFAKLCFETLLDFSLLPNEETLALQEDSSLTNKLAITSLLQRFKEVLIDAIDGEKLNKNIPLQRQKTAEIAFVLKAIATVIASMKRNMTPNSDPKTWRQVFSLYPYLVQCTETNLPQISSSVKDALMEYQDLFEMNFTN